MVACASRHAWGSLHCSWPLLLLHHVRQYGCTLCSHVLIIKAAAACCWAQVGLSHVRDVIVGSPLNKGISGGERKRLCVAMELITRPLLLFLDEPTSGLDSVTALSLCSLLKRLARSKACTVVCTIHQPQVRALLCESCSLQRVPTLNA